MPAKKTAISDPGLLRLLGTGSATALVVSNMIGATIFGTPGLMLGALGSPLLVVLAWAAGAVFAFAGALSYAELGINFPSSGGEFVYLTRAYGKAWGFMTGWVSFFAGFSAPIAAAALIFAYYFERVFPQLGHFCSEQVLAAGLIAACTVVNIFGIRRASGMQNILTTTKVLLIVALIAGGFLFGAGSIGHLGESVARTSNRPLPVEFFIQLLWVMVGYSGWNAATYVAEELRQPERTLPRALGIGTALVAILFLGMNLVFFYSTPPAELRNVVAVGQVATANLFGGGVAVVFSVLMAISVMATVNAEVTIGPRVYYAMALNGLFPKVAAKLHPAWRTPVAAIVSQGVCAMVLTVTPIPALFTFIGFSLTIFSVLAVASVFIFRRRSGWQRLPALDWMYPLIPLSYVVVGTATVLWGIVFVPVVSLAAIATMAAGVVAYRVATREQRRS